MNSEEIRDRFLGSKEAMVEETVLVGGMPFRICSVTSPSQLLHIQKEAKARMKAPSLMGEGRIPAPEEILFYTWLEHGLVAPKLSFDEIVRGSEGYGLDCIAAGIRVAELSGALPEATGEGHGES